MNGLAVGLLIVLVSVNAQAAFTHELIKQCLVAPKHKKAVVLKNMTMVENFRLYEYKKLSFGLNVESGANLIVINDQEITIDKIQFSGTTAGRNLKSEDLDLLQSDLYLFGLGKITFYCINSPLSGLGKSGSFQKNRAAIVIPIKAKSAKEIMGVIGSFEEK